ncbi:Hypothetical protein LUCI_2219 [Lucifera butyrica]|uniref:Impact N-terminal domain-containing protein n=1 Tax=Lucifera butyrica TaxID=1351585 RepID=A0A498R7M8_9FIRM|nr:YigZ family protein [Lucifera butyrica]VBB06975.1 Hypothetical protein LUCI_2219 [Lucifera butyrica]
MECGKLDNKNCLNGEQSLCYRTVCGDGQAETQISKSRFLAFVRRIRNDDEAARFIAEIKKQHRDANHYCAAYLFGAAGQGQRADDDGEPAGTAGKPILEVLKKTGIVDTAIVVARYFGGIKLGAGGLIRAYGQAASLGIQAAGLVDCILHTRVTTALPYELAGRVEKELRTRSYILERAVYLENVSFTVLVPAGEEIPFQTGMDDWTAGTAVSVIDGTAYVEVPVKVK